MKLEEYGRQQITSPDFLKMLKESAEVQREKGLPCAEMEAGLRTFTALCLSQPSKEQRLPDNWSNLAEFEIENRGLIEPIIAEAFRLAGWKDGEK